MQSITSVRNRIGVAKSMQITIFFLTLLFTYTAYGKESSKIDTSEQNANVKSAPALLGAESTDLESAERPKERSATNSTPEQVKDIQPGAKLTGVGRVINLTLHQPLRWINTFGTDLRSVSSALDGGSAQSNSDEDEELCVYKIPANFDPGYEYRGNPSNPNDCQGSGGSPGGEDPYCPTDAQGYYCDGEGGELTLENGRYYCIYVVACDQ